MVRRIPTDGIRIHMSYKYILLWPNGDVLHLIARNKIFMQKYMTNKYGPLLLDTAEIISRRLVPRDAYDTNYILVEPEYSMKNYFGKLTTFEKDEWAYRAELSLDDKRHYVIWKTYGITRRIELFENGEKIPTYSKTIVVVKDLENMIGKSLVYNSLWQIYSIQ